jgi:transcription-repair coupling factor (superfamily II helicase)
VPKLSHLSGGDWAKKKAHIKERVNELADRLIALYGQRAKQTGFAFPPDDELQAKIRRRIPLSFDP